VVQEENRRRSAYEWRQRIVSACPSCPEVPQGQHKKRQRDAIAEEPEQSGLPNRGSGR
jgi:hypothetical protein